jgi:hypothetical protein
VEDVHLQEDTLQTATEDSLLIVIEDTLQTVIEDILHHVDHLQEKDILNLHLQERITTIEVKE